MLISFPAPNGSSWGAWGVSECLKLQFDHPGMGRGPPKLALLTEGLCYWLVDERKFRESEPCYTRAVPGKGLHPVLLLIVNMEICSKGNILLPPPKTLCKWMCGSGYKNFISTIHKEKNNFLKEVLVLISGTSVYLNCFLDSAAKWLFERM